MEPLPDEVALSKRARREAHRRRWTGGLLGIGMGLAYVLVSEQINAALLPGLSIYSPPPGQPWSAFAGAGLGLFLALTTAWSASPFSGVLLGSLAGALTLSLYTLGQAGGQETSLAAVGAILAVIFVPLAVMLGGLIVLFRFFLDLQQHAIRNQRTVFLIGGIPLLLLLLAAGAGWTRQYPPQARMVLQRANSLIQQGLSSGAAEQLPEALRTRDVPDFLANAGPIYTLSWERETSNRFRIPRPANTEGRESLVIARFANGWMLVCLYPRPEWEPRCKGLSQAEAP
jgi:hypothetical protein